MHATAPAEHTAAPTEAALLHELHAQRFSRTVAGHLCVLTYEIADNTVTFTHTGVHPDLRGHGIAADLVDAGLAWAREEGYAVVPACSYVRVYMQRHPQTQDLLAS